MSARKKSKAMSTESTKDATMSFRLPADERARLGEVAVLMGERAGGGPLPESYVPRAALKRGLDALESEFGPKGKR